jgi:hypothetical protein
MKLEYVPEFLVEDYAVWYLKKIGYEHVRRSRTQEGPDLVAQYKGKEVWVEVEKSWHDWFAHRHHLNRNFRKVKVLVLLSPLDPPIEVKSKLPRVIIHLDDQDFMEWYKPHMEKVQKQVTDVIRDFVEKCEVKDRTFCPSCDKCLHFHEVYGDEPQLGAFSDSEEWLEAYIEYDRKAGYVLKNIKEVRMAPKRLPGTPWTIEKLKLRFKA